MSHPFYATQTTLEGRQGDKHSAADFITDQLVVICSQHCLFYVCSPMKMLTEKSNLVFVLDAPQLAAHSINGILPGFQENGEVQAFLLLVQKRMQSLTIKRLEFTFFKAKSILLCSNPMVKVW